jgi:hypothetical protein
MLHHIREVGPKDVFADSFSECTNGIHRDPTKFNFFSFTGKIKEHRKMVHCWLEVGQEALFGSMCRASNGTSHDSLYRDRCSLEQRREPFHDKLQILINPIVEDLKQSI